MKSFSKNTCTRLSPWSHIVAIGSIAFLLTACGDDITEQINANVGAVETSKDLPECTKYIAGQTAYVSDTHEFLGCDGKEWQTLSANTVSVGDNVCTSTSLSDGSGFEIFCNGLSIGTVKNGAKGEKGDTGAKGDKGDDGTPGTNGTNGTNGKDGAPGTPGTNGTNGTNGRDGTGCKIQESTALTATIACGSETFTMDLTSYVELPEECDANLYEDCTGPMENVDLSGVSQKGPFVIGTDITAYELENGHSLKQTGKTFGGKIEKADGTFDIRTVKLKSTFAYIVADGFYRNEVTGENSASAIKLRAFTNLHGRTFANINLVTHLEYDRILNLVTRKDYSVANAKIAAEREIFKEFYIDNTGFGGFAEDFNILQEGDGNAALLAISALLQGDRDESQLTALLASLSVDLGDNGVWDNMKERAQVADWAMKVDIEGGLAKIRANVEGWKLSDSKAPAFEAPFRNFWMKELDVEECTGGKSGVLFAIKNKNSAYYAANDSAFTEGDSSLVRLICDASGTTPAWRFANDIEKDTVALSKDLSADTAVAGKINTGFVYVKEGGWRHGTDLDMILRSSCVNTKKGITDSTIVLRDTTWYICDKNDDASTSQLIPTVWRKATTAEADTALFGLPKTMKDSARIGNVDKSITYVYEDGKWRYGTDLDRVEGLGPCIRKDSSVIRHASGRALSGNWYKCDASTIMFVKGKPLPYAWREATDQETDTAGINIRAAEIRSNFSGLILKGNLVSDSMNYYVYQGNNIWRKADTLEMDTYDYSTYTQWGWASDGNFDKGSVTGQYYVYDNGWRLENSPLDHDPDLRGCTNYRSSKSNNGVHGELFHKVVGEDSLHYVCLDKLWRIADSARVETEGFYCNRNWRKVYEGNRENGTFYTCEADTFRVLTESEKWAHSVLLDGDKDWVRCGPTDNGISITLPRISTGFICRNGFYEWDGMAKYRNSYSRLPKDAAGNAYEMVYIGTQAWLAKNLRIDIDGAVTPKNISNSDSIAYYGRLYRYDAAVQACEDVKLVGDVNGFDPVFRLPTMDDWNILLSYETEPLTVAKAYKSKDSWRQYEGDDKYLFSAVPAGDAVIEGGQYTAENPFKRGFHEFAYFWTSDTMNVRMDYLDHKIHISAPTYNENYAEKEFFSARCIGETGIPMPPKNRQ